MAAQMCRLVEADGPSTCATSESRFSEDALFAHWDPFIKHAARGAAFHLGGGQPEADDFAQETRIRVLQAFRRRRHLPPRYFHLIIENTVRSGIRRERRAFGFRSPKAVALDDNLVDPQSFLNGTASDRMIVRAWVAGLPERLKTIYELIYEQGHTQREAAAILEISQPRVAQLHRDLLEEGKRGLAHLAA